MSDPKAPPPVALPAPQQTEVHRVHLRCHIPRAQAAPWEEAMQAEQHVVMTAPDGVRYEGYVIGLQIEPPPMPGCVLYVLDGWPEPAAR